MAPVRMVEVFVHNEIDSTEKEDIRRIAVDERSSLVVVTDKVDPPPPKKHQKQRTKNKQTDRK